MCSIVGHFYKSRCILAARSVSQNTRDEKKCPTILQIRPSNKRFIIQPEEYKIEIGKCPRLPSLLMMRMCDIL